MKEKIKKLVDAALLYHTEKDGLRDWAQSPFEKDGFVYATDAKTMIRIPSLFTDSDYRIKYATPNNVGDFFAKDWKVVGTILADDLVEIDGDYDYVGIDGDVFSLKNYNKLRYTVLTLGFCGVNVCRFSDRPGYAIAFRNGNIDMLLMPMVPGTYENVLNIEIRNTEFSAGINPKNGEAFLEKLAAEKKAEEANRRNNIFEVRVVKSAVIYVEALDSDEAIKIADRYNGCLYDEDFDSDIDVYSVSSCPDSADRYMGHIYTNDGVYSVKQYLDMMEEEK